MQSTIAEVQRAARIAADVCVSTKTTKNKVETRFFASTNSLTGHIGVQTAYSAQEATLHD